MIGNSTKKIISLLMVAVIGVLCFTSVACKKKPTQPDSSYQIEAPADNGEDTTGDGELTTNLPTWEKDKVFDDVENKDDNKLTTNLPIWEKNKDFSYLLNK